MFSLPLDNDTIFTHKGLNWTDLLVNNTARRLKTSISLIGLLILDIKRSVPYRHVLYYFVVK